MVMMVRFDGNANVTVLIKDIVELAKGLKMAKVPTPSQLLKSLVEKHVGKKLHVIVDEFNGKMFGVRCV